VEQDAELVSRLKGIFLHSGNPEPPHPSPFLLSRYFFAVSNYFLYGESLIYYFKHIVFVDAYFIPFARHHRFLSFMLYVFGFMAFVSGLKRSNLKHQFGLFCWVHMSLFLTVYSSHFIVNNILEGLVWVWVPASLVICNDVFAYICGMTFGRTPLISLSPKKTVEGFVGAFIITEIFAYGWGTLFMRYKYMVSRRAGEKPGPLFCISHSIVSPH
jgi:phosphatidate cytidylyltransferase